MNGRLAALSVAIGLALGPSPAGIGGAGSCNALLPRGANR